MGSSSSARRWTGLVLGLLLGALFVVAGVMKLAATEFEVQGFARFGYATWFMYGIGGLELVGGLLLLLPRTSFAGAALMVPVMAGALASHMLVGDPLPPMLPAIAVTALIVVRLILAGPPWAALPRAAARA